MDKLQVDHASDEVVAVTGGPPPPRGKGMRTGFTTGACATAAAAAATRALLDDAPVAAMTITLPGGRRVRFLIQRCVVEQGRASCSVIKDGGDDPDVTHGAQIVVSVAWSATPGVTLRAGEGVGTVTRPGLGLEVGGPAINPVPRRMITEHVGALLAERGERRGVLVTVAIPGGATLAKKTLNGRLGIVGGLSILGTTGIVRPFSTAAWRASVGQALDVAAANGLREVLLSTGGRSERYGQQLLGLPDLALIEMGEFTGYALQRAARRGMYTVHLAGMIGKFAKIAQGHLMTHVAGNQVDFAFLAAMAARVGAPADLVAAIGAANTARHVQELTQAAPFPLLFEEICRLVAERCAAHVREALTLDVILFDFDGAILGRAFLPATYPEPASDDSADPALPGAGAEAPDEEER